ncbi:MAG: type II toxin-antitoxin system death-on-curing family toxin [bacterium]
MSDEPVSEHAEDIADLLIQIYDMHEIIIAETGGLAGLRDGFMLHSAVARPFATFAGEELYQTDFEKAAALFHSLIKSHPFMDGTKRTAFSAALYFLHRRGYTIPDHFQLNEIVNFCVSIAEENLQIAQGKKQKPRKISEIAQWFKKLLSGDN